MRFTFASWKEHKNVTILSDILPRLPSIDQRISTFNLPDSMQRS
jgi:hypothetical protein